MIFVSSLAFVVFLAILPMINRYWNGEEEGEHHHINYSFFNIFGKVTMYVFGIFTQHGTV